MLKPPLSLRIDQARAKAIEEAAGGDRVLSVRALGHAFFNNQMTPRQLVDRARQLMELERQRTNKP